METPRHLRPPVLYTTASKYERRCPVRGSSRTFQPVRLVGRIKLSLGHAHSMAAVAAD